MIKSGLGSITKRLAVSVLGGFAVYWQLKVHRDWVWSYFESLLLTESPSPELANVATVSINAITTAFIAGSTTTAAIVIFFVTGNVAAITSMFKWTNAAQAAGSVVSEALNERMTSKSEVDEKIVQEFDEKYRDDPSYRPKNTLPE